MAQTSKAPKATPVPKAPKIEDMANPRLAHDLSATVDESALRAWFDDSALHMLRGELSARGWNATVETANSSSVLKSTYGAYVLRAFAIGRLKGGEDVHVKKLVTVVQDAARAFKGEEFEKKIEGAKSFADFVAQIPDRPSKARGAGSETADEKGAKVLKVALVDADAVITLALGALAELEGDAYRVCNIENAEKLRKTLGLMIQTAKSVNHPAGKALSA